MKKILVFLIALVWLTLPVSVLAKEEFNAEISATYDVDSSGVMTVTQDVTLINLTDRVFPTNFVLNTGTNSVYDVNAFDKSGPLEASTSANNHKTSIEVKFNKQIVGVEKETKWTLKFKSTDFAIKSGKVWQIFVPKIPNNPEISEYKLKLMVPVSFNDPSTISPNPLSFSESGGKVIYNYDKNQLVNGGILANFGFFQILNFNYNFRLSNKSFLPQVLNLPIPTKSEYQDVIIDNIDPKPENVIFDRDGNAILSYKVDGRKSVDVKINGAAKLYIETKKPQVNLSDDQKKIYLRSQKYWDVDNPSIKSTLNEVIYRDQSDLDVTKKAHLIHRYVASLLSFDFERLERSDFQRLGSLAVLNNPTKALSSEYTDLFISLARTAGIPARRVEGFGYTFNPMLRPSSLNSGKFHSWSEYYDSKRGWVMIDPTWESTSYGVDYFSKFDLNHFVISRLGYSSLEPKVDGEMTIDFRDAELEFKPSLELNVFGNEEILAGIGGKLIIEVKNTGNNVIEPSTLKISGTTLNLQNDYFKTSSIPPYGKLEYQINMNTANLIQSSNEDIKIELVNEENSKLNKDVIKKVKVVPIFAHKLSSFGIIGVIFLMILIYLLSLRYHYASFPSNKGKKKH